MRSARAGEATAISRVDRLLRILRPRDAAPAAGAAVTHARRGRTSCSYIPLGVGVASAMELPGRDHGRHGRRAGSGRATRWCSSRPRPRRSSPPSSWRCWRGRLAGRRGQLPAGPARRSANAGRSPEDALHRLHRLEGVGLRTTSAPRSSSQASAGSSGTMVEMGGKDTIVVDETPTWTRRPRAWSPRPSASRARSARPARASSPPSSLRRTAGDRCRGPRAQDQRRRPDSEPGTFDGGGD